MDVVSAILKPVIETLMVPVKKHIDYFISYRKYVRDMNTKMRELNVRRHAEEDHLDTNTKTRLEVSSQVRGWLEEVEKIEAKVKSAPSGVSSCCSVKIRHTVGRTAFEIIKEIESVTTQHSMITWTDRPIPLGRVDTMKASTSTPATEHNDFQSREVTFKEALKALGPNHKAHMIALCGMGGVGKTTTMKRLKKVAEEKKMFNYIVEAVIGEKTDPIAIQQAVADYLCIKLEERSKEARAEKLRKWFRDNSDEGKTKFLIVLDDVWESVDLEDIGLSPFPNQGVDFKILLTSRNEHVCTVMGVKDNSIVTVGLLKETEAQSLFWQYAETSDPELHKIGQDIITKCCGLPIAIKTLACTLTNKKKDAWEDALSRLQNHDIENVAGAVFRTSYEKLPDEETKRVFLICGLFPEDFDIPTEELTRYGWGLKLFHRVRTIREARKRLNTCIERLVQTNLLIEGDDGMHVKMHDLVRDFVLGMFSEVEHLSVVNHGNMHGWPENDMTDSCKSISLTCKGISEFPGDLKFPNLTILKLMHGDKSLSFPEDFYDGMEKLQVISYDKMKYSLLPPSPQCSTNLRVFHLHACSLKMFDCSSVGNLLNLEVLSFANSGIEWLPSTIGNLKKLRLLDLTNCYGLRIDNSVLRNLVKLEELYMGCDDREKEAISFTDENCNELAELSKNLSVLEIEFFENNVQPQHMSFKKLQSFKISVGCYLDDDLREIMHSSENTLLLAKNKAEVLECRINELFEKTEVIGLSVGDINDLEELVEVKSPRPPQSSPFYNLRVLFISGCAELRYLFTPAIANTLSKLEHLKVCKCDNIVELIHTGGSEEETITFPKLKLLSLCGLPKLLGLCYIIELPELVELKLADIPSITSIYPKHKLEASSLLKEEVVFPKLRKISVGGCDNLVNLFPCNPIPLLHHLEELIVKNCGSIEVLFDIEFDCVGEIGESNSGLKIIKVIGCDNLVNLFPCNPIPLLHHVEELIVKKCGSIEVLFDIDLDYVGEIGEGSSLRSIEVEELGKLREVWRIKGVDNSCLLISGFQAVESIKIKSCWRFRNVFTPITTNFDLGALMEFCIYNNEANKINNESAESSKEELQTGIITKEETTQVIDSNSKVAFPSSLTHSFHNLCKLQLLNYGGAEVVFEIESPKSRELVSTHHNQQRLLPNLEELYLRYMDNMSHVWKCNWNKFLSFQNQQSESPFHNLTTIFMINCKSIKYLLSPPMAKLLSNLKEVRIEMCYGIEEVVSNRDDEDEEKTTFTSTSSHRSITLFPRLDSLNLYALPNLKSIGGGGAKDGSNEISLHNTCTTTSAFVDQFKLSQAGGFSWSLCQYAREIRIENCHVLSSVIPRYAAGQMQKLQVLKVWDCPGLKEVFETHEGISNSSNSGCDEGIPRLNNVFMLPNLNKLNIYKCNSLEHIFTFSALESLTQLEELSIWSCKAMKVIVKEEKEGEQTTTNNASSNKEVVVFPRLKSIQLGNLPELEGFFLGMNIEFRWPSLDEVMIAECPKMTVFAPGGSTAPRLRYIQTGLGKHNVGECGLNFHVTTATHHQIPVFPSVDGTSFYPATTLEGTPWSFHNLIELDVSFNDVKKIIPSSELLQLQKLERIEVYRCRLVEEIFEEPEAGTNSSGGGFDESQKTVVKLPNLRQVELRSLIHLRYIWKSYQWTVFEFPNLTRVDISHCNRLEHVFTSSMVGSLLQLQELNISECYHIKEVIVKDENVAVVQERQEEESDDGKPKNEMIMLPCLKSLTLDKLPRLKGFCLGKEDFSFPLLDTLIIKTCPEITIFTNGNSATPHLKEIQTNFGSFYAGEEGINSFIKAKQEEFKTD